MTPSQQLHDKIGVSLFKWISSSVIILTTLVSCIAWASSKSAKIDQHELDIIELRAINKENSEQDIRRDKELVEIRTDLKYIIKILEKK